MRRTLDILMVDDSETDAQLVHTALLASDLPHNLHNVTNGDDALSFLRCEPPYGHAVRPDLILLDLNMPEKSGHEVLAEFKADDDFREIPVIILSTSKSPDDIRQAYRGYASSYVTKPMGFDELVDKLAKGLDHYWVGVAELPPKSS